MVTYQINCSYGEIIDKITILNIKLENVKDTVQRSNILYEYKSLKKHIKDDDSRFNILYNKLYDINKQLWSLEDTIRYKSHNKIFDQTFIKCATQIHIMNDKRYSIKNKLNNMYNSTIKEEKIYNISDIEINNISDNEINNIELSNKDYQDAIVLYNNAMTLYYNYKFQESYNIFIQACTKVVNHPIDDFIAILYFSYHINIKELDYSNRFRSKLDDIIHHIKSGKINDPQIIEYCEKIYSLLLLNEGNYINQYVKTLSPVVNKNYNISPDNMSFLKKDDINKTQLIYFSGGLGDKIMYSRFLDKAITYLNGNKLILLVDDCLYWIYKHIYNTKYKNILVIKYSTKIIPAFNAHCSVHMISYYLELNKNDIYENHILSCLPQYNSPFLSHIVESKKNIIINWKGNQLNKAEQFNRGISLEILEPLFKRPNINWISVQKNIIPHERELMKKYNITNLEHIDSSGDAFKDTISLFNKSNLIITTDTSFVHIAGSIGPHIKCYILLTLGCDWRWNNPLWYSNIKQFRQKKPLNWKSVIKDVEELL